MDKFFPVKRKTTVDFIRTEVSLGEKDGEVVVKSVAKINFSKLGIDGWYDVYQKRFPWITKKGTFEVTGRAVCGDEPFDFEKGKRIAETRAQAKAYNIASRVYDMIFKELDLLAKYAKFYSSNCKSCEESAANHINELDVNE